MYILTQVATAAVVHMKPRWRLQLDGTQRQLENDAPFFLVLSLPPATCRCYGLS